MGDAIDIMLFNPNEVVSSQNVNGAGQEEKEKQALTIDPEFPFGRPENIDWTKIDPEGHELIQEVNKRVWMKTTEYYGGEPIEDFNVYELLDKLNNKFTRGIIPDVSFRHTKRLIREDAIARFFLNVNVYNLPPFFQWVQSMSANLISLTNSTYNPIVIRLNPMRPHLNFSVYWDYWSPAEKTMIHELALQTLKTIPV